MVEPVSLICMAAVSLVSKPLAEMAKGAVDDAVGGFIGNRADAAFCKIFDATAGQFIDQISRRDNHDLLKGLLEAHKNSLMDMAKACREMARSGEEIRLSERIIYLAEAEQKAELSAAVDFMPIAQPLVAGLVDGPTGDRFTTLISKACDGVIADLEARMGEDMPTRFKTLFAEGIEGQEAWHERFRFHLCNEIKLDKKVRYEKIFVASTVSQILGHVVTIETLSAAMDKTLRRVEDKIDEINIKADKVDAKLDRLIALGEASPEGQRAIANGATVEAFIALAKEINRHVEKPEHALLELKAALDRLAKLEVLVEGAQNLDERVNQVIKEIGEANRAGRFDQGAQIGDQAFSDWEARQERERQSGLKLIETQIETHLFRRDAETAAMWVEKRICLERKIVNLAAQNFFDEIETWGSRGDIKGVNLDLAVAIEIARRAVDVAKNQDERCRTLSMLATALALLGARESGSARLEESVKTYRLALSETNREQMPLDWAKTQVNLANTLANLGQRESGTARLYEAIAAYQLAIEVLTRAKFPFEWATMQLNLGTSLQLLGRREGGTKWYEAALEANRLTLDVWTRSQFPFDWAITQNNIGNVLRSLGEEENDMEKLLEAVEAYHLALKVQTRERVPLDWATTQSNLGVALVGLGIRTSGTAQLEEALVAHHLALQEQTFERVPFEWATTTLSLGVAQANLAERRGDLTLLEEAETEVKLVREVASTGGHERLVGRSDLALQLIADIRIRLSHKA